jgi:hypothetical protein
MNGANLKIKAIIDRIEDQKAVLRFKNFRGEIILPVKALPRGCVEGSVINFTIEKDVDETGKLVKEIDEILEEFNG